MKMKGSPVLSPDIVFSLDGPRFAEKSPHLKKRSVSLGNINDYLKQSTAGSSTAASRFTKDLLSVNRTLPLKGLRKKLGVKFSRSNQDGLEQLGDDASGNEWRKLRKTNSGNSPSTKDEKSKFLSSFDMRKGIRSRHEPVNNPQRPLYAEQMSVQSAPLAYDLGRHRNSADSTDQYIIVDSYGAEDPLDPGSAYETGDDVDGPDGPVPDSERTLHEVDRLRRKIEKTREELIKLQTTKDENVQEYLKVTGNLADPDANQKVKINFEKSNLKTNQSIQALQRKLEKYQRMLRVCEVRGVHGPRRVLKGVQDSVKSGASKITGAVSKPLESLNQLIKKDKKLSSTENVGVNPPANEDENDRSVYSAYSDEDNSSSGSNHFLANSTCSVPSSGLLSEEADAALRGRLNNALMMEAIESANKDLTETVASLKDQLEFMGRSLREERYQSEQLRAQLVDLMNQWNDLTELHQNEMMGLKSDLERAEERIECVNYRSAERADEIEEAVEACVTRVSKMELQQHQQQQLLLSVDGYFDGSGNAKLLFSKVLSLVISIFAVILVIVSSATRVAMPFVSTRTRLFATCVCLAAVILVWKKQDQSTVQYVFDGFKRALSPMVWRPSSTQSPSP